VLLTTPTGGSNVLHFTDDDVPTPVYVRLVQRPEAGGTRITLTGTVFVAGSTTEDIDGQPCTGVSVVSSPRLTCSLPPRQYYKRVVFVVTTPGGTSDPFLYFLDVRTIPTLSNWALAVLGALLLLVFGWRQRSAAAL